MKVVPLGVFLKCIKLIFDPCIAQRKDAGMLL